MNSIKFSLVIIMMFVIQSLGYSQQNKTSSSIIYKYVNYLCELSESYYYEGKIDDAVKIMESNLEHLMISTDELKSKFMAQYSKVLYYKHSVQGNEYERPIELIKDAIALTEKITNSFRLANLYDLMGLALYSQAFSTGKFKIAESYYYKALKLRRQINDKRGIIETIFHLGLIKDYGENEKKQAMLLYRKGYSLAKKGSYKVELSYLARHIASILMSVGKLDSAQYYFNISLNARKEVGLKLFLAPAFSALGDVMAEKKEFARAIYYYSEAIQNSKQNKAYRFQINALLSMGDIELKLNNPIGALNLYKEALEISENVKYSDGIRLASTKVSSLLKQ
ncbi:MAG: hypothetical protein C0412_07340 [Flavobacterium sp.]|nr:hypothetical protein [Flavobacterium sp.]